MDKTRLVLVATLAFSACDRNQPVTGPSSNPMAPVAPIVRPAPPLVTSGPPLNATPLAAVPEGARVVSLGEPVAAIVSEKDPICLDADPLSDVADPCQRFYVQAARDGSMTISLTWESTGDWLSLRAQNEYPVMTSALAPLVASGTVTAAAVYAFEVGMHGADAADTQAFTLIVTQPESTPWPFQD